MPNPSQPIAAIFVLGTCSKVGKEGGKMFIGCPPFPIFTFGGALVLFFLLKKFELAGLFFRNGHAGSLDR